VRELLTLPGGARWSVAGVEFVYDHGTPSTLGRFTLRKPPDLVAKYVDLCRTLADANIVELGIAWGGSSALIALLAQPRKLVACELDPIRVEALDELRAREGLEDVVRPYYGVDQSDRSRLEEIMETEFGATPLDLVIDDASHLYVETLASFDVLYPRLRPGGVFIIEDWAADHTRAKFVKAALEDTASPHHAARERALAEALALDAQGLGPRPLHRLGAELMELAFPGEVVADIVIDRHWIAIRRGTAELDPATFRLADQRSGDWEWRLP
jgi:predicted O-methyltransferase YrrM